jgi:hypothetical protein
MPRKVVPSREIWRLTIAKVSSPLEKLSTNCAPVLGCRSQIATRKPEPWNRQSSQLYNTDVIRPRMLALFSLLFSMHLLTAQQSKFIDLSNVEQRTSLRVPLSEEPNCTPQPCVVDRAASVAACTTPVSSLQVVLERVTPANITLEPFDAEFRVLNSGTTPVEIPVSPDLTSLQPPGPLQDFDYVSIGLRVLLDAVGPRQAFGLGGVELYGSASHPGTLLVLEPGHWIRVKAKVRLHTWPSQPVDVRLRGDFWMHKNVFRPEENGGVIASLDLCPNRTILPDSVEAHFSPVHSKGQQAPAAFP